MILVITGMEVHPFDRLAIAIDDLAASGLFTEEFFIQLGACNYQPKHARFERFLPFGDLCEKIRSSTAVITHAGAGSTLTCIQQGKFPILVPRRASHGEHIDDHQIPFTKKMCETGHATAVLETCELASVIKNVQGRTDEKMTIGNSTELTDWLEGFWTKIAENKNRKK